MPIEITASTAKTTTWVNSVRAGSMATTLPIATAAMPSHNKNAPGANASAAISARPIPSHAYTSQPIEALLGELGDAGGRAEGAGRLHRQDHPLLVRRRGERLQGADVVVRDEVVDRLQVALRDRLRQHQRRFRVGFGQALARFGVAERG